MIGAWGEGEKGVKQDFFHVGGLDFDINRKLSPFNGKEGLSW